MRVSIIIPAYNARTTIANCLEACLRQTYEDLEVIVVDDGSGDDTSRIVHAFPVNYIRHTNQGPAAARNRGAAMAIGEFLAFTDADCIPARDWVERLVAAMDDNVVGVGGTYDIANRDSLLARMVHEEIVERHQRFGDDVDFLGSFNVMYRRKAFDAVGGFDPSFSLASGEDNDLAYRLLDQGGRLRFTEKAMVAHHHPERLGSYLRTQMAHGYWRMKLYAKHPGRTRGDHYADIGDLLAPGFSLLLIGGLPVALAGIVWLEHGWYLGILYLLLAGLYGWLRMRLPLQIVRRTGNVFHFLFAGIAALRDVARAVGMFRGAWRFLLVERGRS